MTLVIALEEIFGKHFIIDAFYSVYFDSILNEKWLFLYKNNDISCTRARGHAPSEEILKKCAIWCVLVYIWILH